MVKVGLSGPALVKAGANVSAVMTASADGEMDSFIDQANDYLKAVVKAELVANEMLDEYTERSAAVEAITYDMSGYTTRIEAEDMINIHIFRMNEIIKLLDDSSVQDFIGV